MTMIVAILRIKVAEIFETISQLAPKVGNAIVFNKRAFVITKNSLTTNGDRYCVNVAKAGRSSG